MNNPFAGMSAAEVQTAISRGREEYFKRDSLDEMMKLFPNFEEVFDSLAARIGEPKAVATAHASMIYMNYMNYISATMVAAKISGAGLVSRHILQSAASLIIDFMVFQSGIDPMELFTLLKVLNRDVDTLFGPLIKGKDNG